MAKLVDITSFLNSTLETSRYRDSSLNGLQVDAGNSEVKKVGYAVDAGLTVLQEAVTKGLHLLIVHHGLFWGGCDTITGVHGERIRTLIQGGCSLYAAHIPLDGHQTLGNAAGIADLLTMTERAPFITEGEDPYGIGGIVSETTIESVISTLESLPGFSRSVVLPFGEKSIKKVAVVTGAASFCIPHCAERGFDLLITGEPKQDAYHTAKDLGLNVIFAGHYATEVFGVQRAAELVANTFGLGEAEFVNVPTGI